ncbi:MAG: PEP-CTERM sorting domain-containing protein [Planctomycetia bacterium]|nr:PEP-CTERM sorting domain-containing protein [Planctomycetia bacterium]
MQGAEYYWTPGASGSFTDAAMYEGGVAPDLGDWGVFTSGDNTISVSSSGTLQDNAFRGGRSMLITGGTGTFTTTVSLCDNSAITLNGDDTTYYTLNGTIRVGHLGTGTATLNVHGGTLEAKSWFAVGRANPGEVNLTGGKILVSGTSAIVLGDSSGSSATVRISGGIFENRSAPFYIGSSSYTKALIELSQTGTLKSATLLEMGRGTSSTGTIRMTGGTLEANKGITMGGGNGSTGNLNISGGTATVSGADFIIGNNATANASVTLSGGSLSSATNILVGNSGTGTLAVSGGSLTATGSIQAAVNAGSTGEINVSGGTIQTPQIRLNWTGTGTAPSATAKYTQSAGTVNVNAFHAGGGSEIKISGGTLNTLSDINYWGENTHYVQTGGTVTINNTLRTGVNENVARGSAGTTVLDIAGGTLEGKGWIGFGYGNATEVNVYTGATLKQGAGNTGSRLVVGDGYKTTLTLAGGEIDARSLRVTSVGTLRLNAVSSGFGTLYASGADTTNLSYEILGTVAWGVQTGATVLSAKDFAGVITSGEAISGDLTGVNGIWNITTNDTKTSYSAELASGSQLGGTYSDWGNEYLFANPTDKGWIALDKAVTSLGNYEVSLFLTGGTEEALGDLALWMKDLLQYDPELELADYDTSAMSLTLRGFATELGERYLAFDFSQYNLGGTNFMVRGFSAEPVPEPSTILLLLAGVTFLWRRRRF